MICSPTWFVVICCPTWFLVICCHLKLIAFCTGFGTERYTLSAVPWDPSGRPPGGLYWPQGSLGHNWPQGFAFLTRRFSRTSVQNSHECHHHNLLIIISSSLSLLTSPLPQRGTLHLLPPLRRRQEAPSAQVAPFPHPPHLPSETVSSSSPLSLFSSLTSLPLTSLFSSSPSYQTSDPSYSALSPLLLQEGGGEGGGD